MTLRGILVTAFVASSISMAIAAPSASSVLTPQPTPSAAGSQKELKLIGRVRVSVCGNIVVHANSAITSALHNDLALSQTVDRLKHVDFESDPLSYQRGVTDLDRLAGMLHDNAVHGVGEVQRLRDLANGSKDPTRKAELRAFADALGGALYRQKKAAVDLTGFVSYLQAKENRRTPDLDRMIAMDHMDPPNFRGTPASVPSPFDLWPSEKPNEMAVMAARDFQQRQEEIALDEGVAEDHAEGATTGC